MKKKSGFTLRPLTTTIFHTCAKLAGEPSITESLQGSWLISLFAVGISQKHNLSKDIFQTRGN
jgi:hypothetical protein